MMDCKKIKKDLVAFLYGELREDEKKLMEAHLDACNDCRKELHHMKEVIDGADSLQEDIEKAMASVDWEELPSRITETVFAKEASLPRERRLAGISRFFFQPKLRPVYAALLIGVLLGSFITFMVLRSPLPRETGAGEFFVSQDFLERVELEMARRETLDYLEESQYLLLDFIQSPSEKSAEFWQSEFAFQKARGLLAKKKYISPQLDKFKMAKAKAICDQIEYLFYELTEISVQLSEEEISKIQNVIEEKKLLLKIKLLKKELEQSEV
ncbi:MAG: hypothetical protein GTN73_05885 [Candidatus Aminicenantes bacterium]|nr:hypothetical protein [Candidatus Aminicenantes bacterium]